MHEDQPVDRVRQAELAEQISPRQQRDLAGHEHAEQHAAEDDLRTRETPLGQHVAVDGAQNGGDDGGRDHHRHGIPEVALNARALAADAEIAPGLRPGIETEALRQGDEAVGRDFRQGAERIEDHHEERDDVDDREQAEQPVDHDA